MLPWVKRFGISLGISGSTTKHCEVGYIPQPDNGVEGAGKAVMQLVFYSTAGQDARVKGVFDWLHLGNRVRCFD